MTRQAAAGSSLIEATVALALSALFMLGATRAAASAATVLASVARYDASLTAARDLLEARLGAPCGSAYRCPEGLRCSLTSSAAPPGHDGLALDLVTAKAGPDAESAAGDITLSVLVRVAETCP